MATMAAQRNPKKSDRRLRLDDLNPPQIINSIDVPIVIGNPPDWYLRTHSASESVIRVITGGMEREKLLSKLDQLGVTRRGLAGPASFASRQPLWKGSVDDNAPHGKALLPEKGAKFGRLVKL
jgi:hypothetical protein